MPLGHCLVNRGRKPENITFTSVTLEAWVFRYAPGGYNTIASTFWSMDTSCPRRCAGARAPPRCYRRIWTTDTLFKMLCQHACQHASQQLLLIHRVRFRICLQHFSSAYVCIEYALTCSSMIWHPVMTFSDLASCAKTHLHYLGTYLLCCFALAPTCLCLGIYQDMASTTFWHPPGYGIHHYLC